MDAGKRQLAVLYELLIHDGSGLDYTYLCSHFDVCAKTIRKDIHTINDSMHSNGIRITYKKGTGYRLKASMQDVLDELKQQFEYRFIDSNDIETKLDTRVNAILFYFFEKDRYVKLDELSEYLNLNQRTVSSLLKEVHKVLDGYRIKLAVKPHYGMRLEGRETDIRYCFTDTVCFYSQDNSTSDLFEDSLSLLSLGSHEKERVTKICLEYVNLSGCPLSQISIRKLIVLIMITHKRITHNHPVQFTDEQREILDAYSLHLNMPWLIRQLNELYQLHEDVTEVYLLKLFIITNLDYSEQKYRDALPMTIQKSLYEYQDAADQLLRQYGIMADRNQRVFDECLYPVIARMAIRSAFSIVENNPNSYLRKAVNNSPLSVSIGLLCYHELQNISGSSFGTSIFIELCLAAYSCIRRTRNISKMNRLAIFTPADRASGVSLKRRILDRYSNVIQQIDVVTTADLIKKDMSEYNYLILFEKEQPLGLHSDIPQMQVDYFFNEHDVLQFYEQVANPSRIYKKAFGELHASDYNLSFKCSRLQDVLDYIRSITDDHLVRKQLDQFRMTSHLISNSTLNLIFFTKKKSSTFSRLLVMNHYMDYGGLKYNRIFIHVIAVDADMIKLKTSEKVTRNLTMIEDTADTIMINPFIDFYDYYILLQKRRLT